MTGLGDSAPLVLLIAPWRTATDEEQHHLQRVKRDIVLSGRVPLFLPHMLESVLDDGKPLERAVALELSLAFVQQMAKLPSVQCVMVGARITEGMAMDLVEWRAAGREDSMVQR